MYGRLFALTFVTIMTMLVGTQSSASAGIVTFTDADAFRAAVDGIREIDFETLPDGSPSVGHTAITPDFNYADQGVIFSSPFPVLEIGAFLQGGYPLVAFFPVSSGRNWIAAEFLTPVLAVGVFFPGHTTLSLFDEQAQLLGSISNGGSGSRIFAGVISDVPIASIVQDRGSSIDALEAILFVPVPEPTTGLLLALVAGVFMHRGRR